MKKLIFNVILAASLLFISACNQTNNEKTDTINYMSVDDVFAKGETLSGKTVHVEGIIEHVCKHGGKRFKIIGKNHEQFIKIELGDKFQAVDNSIIGKMVKVTGKLIPIKMDIKKVEKWEITMRENHKGEEDTEHFKEEIAFIQGIHQQITSGKIPHYTNYTIEAEGYELE